MVNRHHKWLFLEFKIQIFKYHYKFNNTNLRISIRGGDKIKRKTLYMSLFIFGLITSSFYVFGTLENYGKTNLDVFDLFKAVYGVNEDNTISSKTNAKSKIKKSNELSVQGKCSCSLYSDYETHRAIWINYCPQCHKYGTLRFTRGGDSPEGMLYCTCCDADYCVVHGKEHVTYNPKYLIPV